MTFDVGLECDVVVVGAGFSGLAAATALHTAGRTVIVIEARDRVGGKVESSVDSLGQRFDSGGQYVADEMPEVRALVAAAGGRLVRNQPSGRSVTVPAGCHREWDRGEAAYEALRDRSDDPSNPDGERWFDDWVEELPMTDCAKAAVRSTADGQMCMDHRHLGLAHVADQLRRTPPLAAELQYSVDRTMHAVAEHLASTLDVRTSSPVRNIEVYGGSVVARTPALEVRARHAIVAVPPAVVHTIEFRPTLPRPVATAATKFVAADVTKIRLRYRTPFWREAGLDGTVRFTEPSGLYVADASVADAHALVVFVGGPLALAWRALGDGARLATVLERVAGAFGADACAPIDVHVRDWPPDEWGGGGYCQFVPGLGEPNQIQTLLGGAPGITFAATELSDRFPGYIEGALRAGRLAADRAVARLRTHLAE